MNCIDSKCLDIVKENLFAIQTLLGIDAQIDRWWPEDNGIIISITGKLSKSDLPDRLCRGIKKFYSYILKRELGEDIRVNCEYDLRNRFELYIY